MIAAIPSLPPVCRMCGYRCGRTMTGCGYDPWDMEEYGKWGPPATIQAPPPIPVPIPVTVEWVEFPVTLPKRVPRPQIKIPSTGFVGAGAMRRRWR